MWRYVCKRLLMLVFVFVGVAFLIFTITYFIPGDPAALMLGESATVEEIRAMQVKLGIDKPYFQQLVKFLSDVFLHLDFGMSWNYEVPVMQELVSRLPRTIGIGLSTIVISVSLGIPLGVQAALNRGKWQDYGIIAFSMVLISLPGFWVAFMMILIFAIRLGWLPSYGIGGIQYYILPVICGSFGGLASFSRQSRSAMLEVIRADFVTTARAKGQHENVIITKHMLPNALLPIITMIGGRVSHIVAGSTLTERVFAIPGVGTYLLTGVSKRDYPIIRGCALFFSVFSAVMVLITDLVYAAIDPRIKAQYAASSAKKRG